MESTDETITISIVGWEKFNTRKDLKSMPWFKLDSKIVYSQSLFGLSPKAKWFWVCLISWGAQKVSGEISLELDYASHHSGCDVDEIKAFIEKFKKKGLVRIITEDNSNIKLANESVRDTNGSVSKRREEEKREEEGEKRKPARPFELLNPDLIKVTPDEIVSLYNQQIGNNRNKTCQGIVTDPDLDNFFKLSGFMPTENDWYEYFKRVLKAKWLCEKDGEIKFGLLKLIEPKIYSNVWDGMYDRLHNEVTVQSSAPKKSVDEQVKEIEEIRKSKNGGI